MIFAILSSHLLRAGIGNGHRVGGKFGARVDIAARRSRGGLYSTDFQAVKAARVRARRSRRSAWRSGAS
ncbi:MAG: hypothetical protein WCA36_09265, partial [Pseudolabrys sp.]